MCDLPLPPDLERLRTVRAWIDEQQARQATTGGGIVSCGDALVARHDDVSSGQSELCTACGPEETLEA